MEKITKKDFYRKITYKSLTETGTYFIFVFPILLLGIEVIEYCNRPDIQILGFLNIVYFYFLVRKLINVVTEELKAKEELQMEIEKLKKRIYEK